VGVHVNHFHGGILLRVYFSMGHPLQEKYNTHNTLYKTADTPKNAVPCGKKLVSISMPGDAGCRAGIFFGSCHLTQQKNYTGRYVLFAGGVVYCHHGGVSGTLCRMDPEVTKIIVRKGEQYEA
jgi:hypothetical protein